jgi:hypothetical protein
VEVCDDAALRQFGMQSGYARMLLQASQIPSDELLAAVMRSIAVAHAPQEREYLVRVGRELALLLRDDFERLRHILARLTP